MQHDEIDTLLRTRRAPPVAGPQLAERIIHLALTRGQDRATSIWQELAAMFALPHPAVAVAASVMIGLAAGLQASAGLDGLQTDWASFLDLTDGGWL